MRSRDLILLLTLVAFVVPAAALQEKADVAKPVVVDKTITEFEIAGFAFSRLPEWKVTISYVDNLGTIYVDEHTGTTQTETNPNGASAFVITLNKANLSTKSLERRLLEHLQSEGKIPAASITGSPR